MNIETTYQNKEHARKFDLGFGAAGGGTMQHEMKTHTHPPQIRIFFHSWKTFFYTKKSLINTKHNITTTH